MLAGIYGIRARHQSLENDMMKWQCWFLPSLSSWSLENVISRPSFLTNHSTTSVPASHFLTDHSTLSVPALNFSADHSTISVPALHFSPIFWLCWFQHFIFNPSFNNLTMLWTPPPPPSMVSPLRLFLKIVCVILPREGGGAGAGPFDLIYTVLL